MPGETDTSVSPLLRWLGFEVTTNLDAGLTELNQPLRMVHEAQRGG